eukprot:CAMPEP_0194291958 /NCGR_PEP_ID=MMETSP0169-20130528/44558_1 /TAXON_ID=218684 /ORGANISM="Corethron pennatum, Strain L29A3" /LENGTH=575 /DNA_ID=CAMNT_0039039989 /DNA_START=28 /DNA_END=1755 /DNA_ORIENTATION=-
MAYRQVALRIPPLFTSRVRHCSTNHLWKRTIPNVSGITHPVLIDRLCSSWASPIAALRLSKSTTGCYGSIRSSGTWTWASKQKYGKGFNREVNGADAAAAGTAIDPEVQTEVMRCCAELHSSAMPLNERIRGPLEKNSNQSTSLPFVLLVGNHSSGKSTFVNHVLGREVQTSGVAPTDDCFTIIAPGPRDIDQDGPAVIGDPDMGFGNLRQFGPALIHHTQLKIRSDVQTRSFMLVDSPGMIDSPASHEGMMLRRSKEDDAHMDRGYDFEGVVRWYAERADVILLFFDPDKPGTTGETLSILVHALGGMDHKLLIILNKADQFRRIHDFARAYGSLCWNLSKVIPRKDLPKIYTMCLPVPDMKPVEGMNQGLEDLQQAREEVIAEVMKAPKRRIDNAITRLSDSINLLRMHSVLMKDIQAIYNKEVWMNRLYLTAAVFGSTSGAIGSVYMGVDLKVTSAFCVTMLTMSTGMGWYNSQKLSHVEKDLVSNTGLSLAFQRSYARQIAEGDEFTTSVWNRVKTPLRLNLQSLGLSNVPSVSNSDIAMMDNILDEDVPRLRRMASPSHFGSIHASLLEQ